MNCIIIDDDKLSRRIIEEFIEKTEFLELNQSFSSAIEAINYLKNNDNINIIFLDIEMPEMTGIDFLNTLNSNQQVIIISSKGEYALNAFEYDVTDYLLKPISYSRFFKAIDKAYKRFYKEKIDSVGNDEIFIKKNSTFIRLKYEEILWIEALENYVVFNTFKDKFMIHFTLKAIEQKLPQKKFVRVHRSYIVNLSNINILEDNSIIINVADGKKSIPIGKLYKDKLMNDLNIMLK
ncbi:MAG: LytR/AlgR family response regulator transcription factor [Bacteroidota bacterium]